jgi:branched-chain amino acid transport system permease protein
LTNFIQRLTGGILVGATYALVALGFSLVFRVTGVINLAQGAFCVIGALVSWSLEARFGWPTILAVPSAVLVTTIFGTTLGACTFVPGLVRLSNANMLMLTAGLLTLIEGSLLLIWG